MARWTSSRTRPAPSSPRAGRPSCRRWSVTSRTQPGYSARSRPSTSANWSKGASLTAHRTARAANRPDPNRRDQQPARPSRRAPLGRGARRRGLEGWLFVLPALLMYAVFVLQPLALTIQYSLYRWNGVGPATWVGLANYVTVLRDPDLFGAIINSLELVLFFSIVPVSLGLVTASVIHRVAAGRL